MIAQTVQAIIPYYTSYGENATAVVYSDGSVDTLPTPIRSYLRRLLYEVHLDPKALQYWTSTIIGAKLNTPLTISEDIIFIPVKMRHAIGKSDGCFGYVLSKSITHIADHSLTLGDHTTLPTLSSRSFINKKQRDARLLRYAYIEHRKNYSFMHI